jgi:hypothetical protein
VTEAEYIGSELRAADALRIAVGASADVMAAMLAPIASGNRGASSARPEDGNGGETVSR